MSYLVGLSLKHNTDHLLFKLFLKRAFKLIELFDFDSLNRTLEKTDRAKEKRKPKNSAET